MSFSEVLQEFRQIIAPLFDEEQLDTLTSIELTSIRGNLTYTLGNLNTIGLKEKETASEDRRSEIDRLLREAERFSYKAFDSIDKLLADPKRLRPSSETGTIPKKTKPEEEKPLPRPLRVEVTLPSEIEQTFAEAETSATSMTEKESEPRVSIDNDILQNVIAQLREEFERLYRQANSTTTQTEPEPILAQADPDSVMVSKKSSNETLKPKLDLKLDRVKLPTFGGNIPEWIAFRDQYTDLVHENQNLSPILKFYQLRSCLTGKAAEVINGFQLSSTDYEAAWEALKQRFDNKDRIVSEYIKRVLHLPTLDRNPSKEKLLNMVDRTNQMIRVLPHLEIDIDNWGPFLKVILLEKLDSGTERQWLDEIKRRENVPLQELLEFLELRAAEAAIVSQKPQARPNPKPQPQQKKTVLLTSAETEPPKQKENKEPQISRTVCPHPKCDQFHPPYRCQKFLSLSPNQRNEYVKKAGLCIWCLNLHKAGKKCSFGNCKICKGEHNNLLCTKPKESEEEEANEPPQKKD